MLLVLCSCAVGLYMLASYVLLQYPLLLHKKKYPPLWLRSSHRIAHRGGRQELPENTVEAFTHALTHCDVLELDVWLSADGAVVVFHDDHLGRMTGGADTRPLPEVHSDTLPLLRPEPSEGWDQGHSRDQGRCVLSQSMWLTLCYYVWCCLNVARPLCGAVSFNAVHSMLLMCCCLTLRGSQAESATKYRCCKMCSPLYPKPPNS